MSTINEAIQSETLLTVDDVARRCGVTDQTVRNWLRSGHVSYLLVGPTNRLRIRPSELDRIMQPADASHKTSTR